MCLDNSHWTHESQFSEEISLSLSVWNLVSWAGETTLLFLVLQLGWLANHLGGCACSSFSLIPEEEAVWLCFGGFLRVLPLQEFCAYCSAEWCVNVSEWKEQFGSKKISKDLHDGTEKT